MHCGIPGRNRHRCDPGTQKVKKKRNKGRHAGRGQKRTDGNASAFPPDTGIWKLCARRGYRYPGKSGDSFLLEEFPHCIISCRLLVMYGCPCMTGHTPLRSHADIRADPMKRTGCIWAETAGTEITPAGQQSLAAPSGFYYAGTSWKIPCPAKPSGKDGFLFQEVQSQAAHDSSSGRYGALVKNNGCVMQRKTGRFRTVTGSQTEHGSRYLFQIPCEVF